MKSIATWFTRVVFGHFFETILRPYFERNFMSMTELNARLTGINNQLAKVAEEINAKLDELRDAIDAADDIPAEVTASLDALQSKVDSLDSIVPDAAPEPDPEPEPEEPAPEEPTP